MKKSIFCFVLLLLIFSGLNFLSVSLVYAQGPEDDREEHTIGPTEAEQACMRPCVSIGCPANDMTCMKKNSVACMAKCNVKKPESTPETSCMEKCVETGCAEFNFVCQAKNRDRCEKSCGMIKEPEVKSKEEACIRSCVKKASPKSRLKCQPGEGGEKGGEICQSCAKSCEDLYDGPCMNDKKLKEKQKTCETCEHCYGEPVIGDSGQGYKCITDVECKDASDQFGDDPGTGPGIEKTPAKNLSSTVIGASKIIGTITNKIGNFFKGLLGY